MTTPLWVVNTRLKLQGTQRKAKETQLSEEIEPQQKKLNGLVGEAITSFYKRLYLIIFFVFVYFMKTRSSVLLLLC